MIRRSKRPPGPPQNSATLDCGDQLFNLKKCVRGCPKTRGSQLSQHEAQFFSMAQYKPIRSALPTASEDRLHDLAGAASLHGKRPKRVACVRCRQSKVRHMFLLSTRSLRYQIDRLSPLIDRDYLEMEADSSLAKM